MNCLWFIDHAKVDNYFKNLKKIRVPIEIVHITASIDATNLAYTLGGDKIFLEEELMALATPPQLLFVTLHEYAHIKLGKFEGRNKHDCHALELECDEWAMLSMIQSKNFTRDDLLEAARLFTEVIICDGSRTHPPSQTRYKQALRLIEEYVS